MYYVVVIRMGFVLIFLLGPGPAQPAHTRPRPDPSLMCLIFFQPRPGPENGPQTGLGPNAWPFQGTNVHTCTSGDVCDGACVPLVYCYIGLLNQCLIA